MRFFKRNETKGPKPEGEEAIQYSEHQPATVTGSFGRAADGDRVWPNPDDSDKAKFERSLEGLSPKEKQQIREDMAEDIEAEENPPRFIKGDDGEPVENHWRKLAEKHGFRFDDQPKNLYVVEDPVYGQVAFELPDNPRTIDGQSWVVHDETHHLSNEDMSEIGEAYARIKKLANEFASYTVLPQQWWMNPAFEQKYDFGATVAPTPPPLKQSTKYFEDNFDPYPKRLEPWTLDSYALCRQTLADFGLNASYDFFGEKGIIPLHAKAKGGLIRTVTDDRHGTTVTEYDPKTGRIAGQSTTRRHPTSTIAHHTEEKKSMPNDGILPTVPLPTEVFVDQRAYSHITREQLESRGLNSLKVLHGNAVADEKALKEEAARLSELEVELADNVDRRYAKTNKALSELNRLPYNAGPGYHKAAQKKFHKAQKKFHKAQKKHTWAVADLTGLRQSRQNINQLLRRVTNDRVRIENAKHKRIRERDAEIELQERAEKAITCPPLPRGDVSETVVLTFVKKFGLDANCYEYAAISPAGKRTWSVTGQTQMNGISWSKLLQFVEYNEGTPRFRQYALNSMTRAVPFGAPKYNTGYAKNLFIESGLVTPDAR